jgi:uncharacterized protein (TIGR02569 family)
MFPPHDVLGDFGVEQEPVLLEGGQGNTYRAGDVVLKPVEDGEASIWIAEVYSSIEEIGFRVPRPLKTKSGKWSSNGWTGWTYICGKHKEDKWEEKIRASIAFHKAISHFQCPSFFKRIESPWAIADKVAWGERNILFHSKLKPAVDLLMEVLRPIEVISQAIHGDLCGNILFSSNGDPIIIDFTPYWRPADFAIGLLVAEALVWEHADETIFGLVPNTADFFQLLARAELRRIIELQCVHQIYDLVDEQ